MFEISAIDITFKFFSYHISDLLFQICKLIIEKQNQKIAFLILILKEASLILPFKRT